MSDINEARAHCVSRGLNIDETVKIPGAERFFIRDPDGNRIEILQWESKYDPERDGRYRV